MDQPKGQVAMLHVLADVSWPDYWMGVATGVTGTAITGFFGLISNWGKNLRSQRRERMELQTQLSIATVNLMVNAENMFDPSPGNPFPLFHPVTHHVVPQQRERLMEFVIQMEKAATDLNVSRRGMLMFSLRQREYVRHMHVLVDLLAQAVMNVGSPVLHGRHAVTPFFDEPTELVGEKHARRAYEHARNVLSAPGKESFREKLKLSYKFFPWRLTMPPGLTGRYKENAEGKFIFVQQSPVLFGKATH